MVISSPTKPDWNRNYTTTYSCYGTAWSPCPSTLQSAVVEYGNLPEGQNTVRVTVTDAGNKTTVKDWPVRIDRTAPAIELEGEVIDADPVTVGDDEFPVFFSATDAVAGVGRVDLLLDNQTAALDSQSQGCSGGGCPFEGSLALDTASIPEGTHTIKVRVWDGFGNWRDSASQAIVVDKTPPALNLSGALAAADGTTVTAPTYGLTASATDPASGGWRPG